MRIYMRILNKCYMVIISLSTTYLYCLTYKLSLDVSIYYAK